ncbi:phenylalanine-tRNA ligase, beta subunit [Cryptococcus wingfieldii CBS 7118]|uniref:Phenylalanine--tRNA ligase beta subunit n=1 Tax=Cryptococcus wingfieldii CBS 7118 TaxID=1295528 RepID=A0A1E3K2Q7_9TREE|nr:phenylalanine-tRNA ligase, beta subunit [Cryptococcus wingfieldii CBS 7118]ODO07299.1 phenylalanine-tRNA ligase, beta subunit [Cryptococcus wingfieldii CBS 7118]
MPTISVDKAELYRRLEKEYTTQEFDELCFEFGIELDEDTTVEVEEARKKGLPTSPPQLKIEIPANRYDLLCLEGVARALRIFLQKDTPPQYALSNPEKIQEVYVESSTSPLRPYFASAILRLARPLNQLEYESFIDLQDKLHQNLCRGRKFVAIGTHDLDTVQGPFRYICEDPKKIKFAPLNKETESTAEELMGIYEGDRHLGKYLHLIKDAPAYPVIYDSKGQVCSMPPIINSQHSKIVPGKTKNIFIDTTAVDKTKLDIVINMICAMFGEYCEVPFTVEPVRVHMPDGSSHISPPIAPRVTTASSSYINAATGLELSREQICTLLTRMSLSAKPSATDSDALDVSVPCTRPDILHECDIMEDAAIAYGFNNLPQSMPTTNTVAKAFPVNRLGDIIRKECAMAGWIEALPLILCSHDENFAWLNRPDPGNLAIQLANPKSLEYQVVRTSLLPGMLKTARENKALALPMKIFEVSDVAVQDAKAERQARNYRRLCAVYMDRKAGFEVAHGLLDRVMQILSVPFIGAKESQAEYGYYIASADDPTYLPGRAAHVFYRPKPTPAPASSNPLSNIASDLKAALPGATRDINIGSLGILHPSVLNNFELIRPCSSLEIDVEPLL